MLLPTQVRIGDLVEFDGAWFPVKDMKTAQAGGRILHFEGRAPYTMTQAEIVARPISHARQSGSLPRLLI
ncbi:hypothetical protein AB0O76_18195 [Streptomyces sp. NPDC086554]|uniref:hypothetical protein n=1 Tax=Streptomyces sp. NPDC086554 TaxID=3154864 RepID=UPI0034241264